jgi:hypothetical protein
MVNYYDIDSKELKKYAIFDYLDSWMRIQKN